MKYYVISIIMCLLIGLGIDFLSVSKMNIYQDFGILAIALGIGIFFGATGKEINDV